MVNFILAAEIDPVVWGTPPVFGRATVTLGIRPHSSLIYKTTVNDAVITRMQANAQRNGRPAEHRWRPLFNAAKFG